jgi:tetratricopeptide (TPR) repeat protein
MLPHLPKATLPAPLALAALLASSLSCRAQEPSSSLQQADAAFRAGVAAMSHNDLNVARADFENVVRLAPSAEQGHSALGAVLLRLGQTAAAIRELEKALSIRAGDTSAEENLALAWEQSGQPVKALPWFSRLDADLRAENQQVPAEVLAAWARALAVTRQFGPASIKIKQAIAAAPKNAELVDELGSIYAQQADWTDAQRAFGSALQLDPELAMAHFHMGVTLEVEQRPGAMEELEAAYRLAPADMEIALTLAQAMTAKGDDRNAIPVLKHVLEVSPASTTAKYQLGLALQRTDQVREALPLFETAAAAEPGNAEILINLGLALCQLQQAKDAVPILQKAVSLAPKNLTAHENLAAAYIQLSQFDDAITELRGALSLAPDQSQLHYNLGVALKMKDDDADAIPEFETTENLDPSAPEAPYALGMLYLQAGRYADAERELNASLKLRPANGDGWATLGSVYNHLGKLPEAASALQEAIRQRPDQPDSYLLLAEVLVKLSQPAQAAADRKKAADLMRVNMNRQRAEVSSNSGNDLLKDGNVSEAVVEFRDALNFDPDYAEAHLGLANALQRMGNTVEAAAERQKAAALEKKSSQQNHE